MVVDNLSHHLEQGADESLLTVQGLTDHVTFPKHEKGGTLDPVVFRTNSAVTSWDS